MALLLAILLGGAQGVMLRENQLQWEKIAVQHGFLDVQATWESDVYLSEDGLLRGWAELVPIQGGVAQQKWRRFAHVKCVDLVGGGSLNPCHMLGYSWRAKVALRGRELSFFEDLSPPCGGQISFWGGLRYRLVSYLERHWETFEPRERGFLRSLLTGYRAEFSRSDRQHFTRLGLAALLAMSGLHLALAYSLVWWLLRALGVGHFSSWRYLPLIVVYGYASLGAWSIPLFRASVMLTALHFCLLLGRRSSGIQALSFCAFLEMVYRPESLFSLSFQLSYCGVLGIYSALRMSMSGSMGRTKKVPQGVFVSWGAMMWTWPVVLYAFGTMPGWAWVLSPIFFASFALVMAWVFFVFCFSILASCPTWLVWPLEQYLDLVAALSGLQAWVFRAEGGDLIWLWSYYFFLSVLTLSFPKRSQLFNEVKTTL